MDARWHWHGLLRCLTEASLVGKLNDLMLALPAARRTVWLDGTNVQQPDGSVVPAYSHVLPYVGLRTLEEALTIVAAIPSTQWLNPVLGSRFAKVECLERQTDVVAEFRNPVVRAGEIRALIEGAIPGNTP